MSLKDPLLITKLHLPSLSNHLVSRPRLTIQLNGVLQRKFTFISAPAGYGKTTLLCEWFASLSQTDLHDMPRAWVSLDEGDYDPARFWSYILMALDQIHAGMSEQALTLLHSPQPPSIETILTTQINVLLTIQRDFVLVLDDYHVIATQSIHHDLAFLLEHMPPQMHIILLSRSYPPFSLSRLRTHRQVVELHATDLHFTTQEVAKFIKEAVRLNISMEDIATLEMQTEGWAAGLQLAALSLQERKPTRISQVPSSLVHYHNYIFDYLADEVFLRQPEHIQTFLLQTSILDRLNGSLCDAVTGNSNSQLLLKQMKQAGVFLVSLDEDDQQYRYHHLFAEFLRSRLKEKVCQDTDETSLAILHHRASVWYQQHGQMAEAIAHTLASEKFNHAEGRTEQALQGQNESSILPSMQKQQQKRPHSLLDSLSTREFEVLQCLIEGMPNAEIADRMVIEESTVKWHLKNIYGKLNVHNRNQAMLKARTLTE
ncbi:MAG: helix-turn-helix transcriptional regulator [Ktedonobacteraceae bacterium]